MKKIFQIVPLILVTALSLVIMAYVGFGDAQQNYKQFHLDKATAQGNLARNLMQDFLLEGLPLSFIESFLKDGLALGKFAGFSTFTEGPLEEKSSLKVNTVTVVDLEGKVFFSTANEENNRNNVDKVLKKLEGAEVTDESKDPFIWKDNYDYYAVFNLFKESAPVGRILVGVPLGLADEALDKGAVFRDLVEDFLAEGLDLKFTESVFAHNQKILEFSAPRVASAAQTKSADDIGSSISVTNLKGEIIFSNAQSPDFKENVERATAELTKLTYAPQTLRGIKPVIWDGEQDYYLLFPLFGSSQLEGSLLISMPKAVVISRINMEFDAVWRFGLIFLGIFILFAVIQEFFFPGKYRLVQFVYTLTFLSMSVVVLNVLINLYSEGAQVKTKALAQTLGQQLIAIVETGVKFDQIPGLDQMLAEHQRREPDISAISLILGGKNLIHTDSSWIGKPWQSNKKNYEYIIPLKTESNTAKAEVMVGMPREIVHNKIIRNVKNFSALFIAAGFIAFLFFNVLKSVQAQRAWRKSTVVSGEDERVVQFSLIKSIWFLTVFTESVSASFLPQYFGKITLAAGLPSSAQSALFAVFFAAFALVLIPAGRYSEKGYSRFLLFLGIFLSACSLLLMTVTKDFYMLIIIRALAGIGQGLAFIGVQSVIISTVPLKQKTQGTAAIVFGLNGGMISGAAIGSLLVVYMGVDGIFLSAGIVTLANMFFALKVCAGAKRRADSPEEVHVPQETVGFFKQLWETFKDFSFVRSFLLVGATSKAVYTGAILFAIPLLMQEKGYPLEDIGQAMMLFAGAVLVANHYIPILSDKLGNTKIILFIGMMLSGAGLILIGMSDTIGAYLPLDLHTSSTIVLILGIIIVGFANGCLSAPVVTYILHTPAAQRLGRHSTTAIYRFLERFGHIAGPLVVGYMLLVNNNSIFTLTVLGGIIILFGLIFVSLAPKTQATN